MVRIELLYCSNIDEACRATLLGGTAKGTVYALFQGEAACIDAVDETQTAAESRAVGT
jgi:hypothetical protein